MATSLGNSEKQGFSALLFQIWEYTKQLQIMKNQKSNHTLTLFFPKVVSTLKAKPYKTHDAAFLRW